MKKKTLALISATSLLFAAGQASAGLVVTPTDDEGTLIGEILGSGITVSPGTEFFGGTDDSAGTFTGGLSAGLGFDEGIILTTGDALDAVGPNVNDATSVGNPDTYYLAELDALVSSNIYDTSYLTFQFESAGDLFFNFQFASEEYNEFVNSSFNDVFGLFVDGVNVAIAPEGGPVSINNVNCGNPYDGTTGPNCDYYNNNDLSDGGPFFDIEYDGFTDAFTASVIGLSAGTHTMTFAIADAGDSVLDSAIFIEAGSFSDEPVNVPEPGTLALLGIGLLGMGLARRRKK